MHTLRFLIILGFAWLLSSSHSSAQQPGRVEPNDVWSVAISPNGKVLAGGAGWWSRPGEVGVWDLATRQPLRRFAEDLGVASVAFSADGRLLASGSWSGHVHVRDWEAGQMVADIAVPGVARVAFAPAGELLALATESKLVQLWDAARGKLVADLQGDLFRFHYVTFSPDGKRVAAGGGDWKTGGVNQVTIWDVASKKQVLKLVGHQNAVLNVAYAPSGKTIATAATDSSVRLWDAESGELLQTFQGHQGYVEGLVFTADGKTLISGCRDNTVRFWDVAGGQETGRLNFGRGVKAVRLTPDGRQLLVGGELKTLKVFDAATRAEVALLWSATEENKNAMDELPETVPARPRGRGGLAAAAGLGLLTLLGVGLWLFAHRRRWGRTVEIAAAVVTVGGAWGCLFLVWLALAAQRPGPASTPFAKAAERVRDLEADTINAHGWTDVTDKDVAGLASLSNLRHLNLDKSAITDGSMKEIGQVTTLMTLSITNTRVSDAGVAELKGLHELKELRLDELPITDAGLAPLEGLTRLTKLSLWRTAIHDAGLAHLRPLAALKHLSLDETSVTDAGLPELYGLAELRYLSVWRTRVTDAGVEALKKAMPAVKVNR